MSPRASAVLVAALAVLTLLIPAGAAQAAPGSIATVHGYETGDFSQWAEVQASCRGGAYDVSMVGDGCASIVRSPVREGSYAAKYVVRPARRADSPDVERAEVYMSDEQSGGHEGQEWFYAWSTMFPAAGNPAGFWPTYADFNVFTSWHNADGPCGGNVVLGIDATGAEPRIYFMLVARDRNDCGRVVERKKFYLDGALELDHWYDFVVRVRWSSDPARGFVEVFADGERWVPRTEGATMFNNHGAYWKQGFYRAQWRGGINTVLHDGARRGTSLAAVMRAPARPAQPHAAACGTQGTRALGGAVRFDGHRFRSEDGLRCYVERRGANWELFLRSRPRVRSLLGRRGVRWGSETFYTRSHLALWLGVHGSRYAHWSTVHPAAAARLDQRARALPYLRVDHRPRVLAGQRLLVRARALPGSKVTLVARDGRGRLLGRARLSASPRGHVLRRLRLPGWRGQRHLWLTVQARSGARRRSAVLGVRLP